VRERERERERVVPEQQRCDARRTTERGSERGRVTKRARERGAGISSCAECRSGWSGDLSTRRDQFVGGKYGGDERECVCCLFGTVLTGRIDEREIDRERERERERIVLVIGTEKKEVTKSVDNSLGESE
jgi:hypothetical protein